MSEPGNEEQKLLAVTLWNLQRTLALLDGEDPQRVRLDRARPWPALLEDVTNTATRVHMRVDHEKTGGV